MKIGAEERNVLLHHEHSSSAFQFNILALRAVLFHQMLDAENIKMLIPNSNASRAALDSYYFVVRKTE